MDTIRGHYTRAKQLVFSDSYSYPLVKQLFIWIGLIPCLPICLTQVRTTYVQEGRTS